MLEKIVAAVRAAGDMIRDAHNIERDTREKTGAADLVTKYDVAVQEFLRRELLRVCPEADFFGEEGQHETLTKDWVFIVDPIDGTTNFVRELHYSNIAVALCCRGEVRYAVVYNPFIEDLFAAEKGCGATLNGRPIYVSTMTRRMPSVCAAAPSMTAAIRTGALPSCGGYTTTRWTSAASAPPSWISVRWPPGVSRSSSSAACPRGISRRAA